MAWCLIKHMDNFLSCLNCSSTTVKITGVEVLISFMYFTSCMFPWVWGSVHRKVYKHRTRTDAKIILCPERDLSSILPTTSYRARFRLISFCSNYSSVIIYTARFSLQNGKRIRRFNIGNPHLFRSQQSIYLRSIFTLSPHLLGLFSRGLHKKIYICIPCLHLHNGKRGL
jgi:hypothetical protein